MWSKWTIQVNEMNWVYNPSEPREDMYQMNPVEQVNSQVNQTTQPAETAEVN